MLTDWVISQPTRRYFAVVDYGPTYDGAKHPNTTVPIIVYNSNQPVGSDGSGQVLSTSVAPAPVGPGLPYAGDGSTLVGAGILELSAMKMNSSVACVQLDSENSAVYDREETTAVSGGAAFSPGTATAPTICGEVATMSWGGSPLGAALTNTQASSKYLSGWATFAVPIGTGSPAYGLPIIGFAGTSASSGTEGYGITYPLRW
jgi:hypothetical protein